VGEASFKKFSPRPFQELLKGDLSMLFDLWFYTAQKRKHVAAPTVKQVRQRVSYLWLEEKAFIKPISYCFLLA